MPGDLARWTFDRAVDVTSGDPGSGWEIAGNVSIYIENASATEVDSSYGTLIPPGVAWVLNANPPGATAPGGIAAGSGVTI